MHQGSLLSNVITSENGALHLGSNILGINLDS